MPGAYDTVCLQAGFGVKTGDPSGCSQTLAFEGELRTVLDSYANTLGIARNYALAGKPTGLNPQYLADDMMNSATYWCKSYPGSCPPDPQGLAAKYVGMLRDLVKQFGFDMAGNYSGHLDNQPQEVQLHPEDVVYTPAATTPNVTSYSPSAGWRLPVDSLPPTLSPTIPAYTSPSNVAATAPGSVTASGGGTDLAGTASGSGASQGGSTTMQSTLNPGGNIGAAVASLAPGSQNSKLLVILLVIAVAVILFGRH